MPMGDLENQPLINGTIDNQIRCQLCQWNEFCIHPPKMTREEVERRIKGDMDGKKDRADGGLLDGMLSVMVFGHEATSCHVCEVFAERLRNGPKLANLIKDIMKNWKEE